MAMHKELSILVVDDDMNFAHTLCDILGSAGHQCQHAHSVDAAMGILEQQRFDCVLSDVRMPGQSGPDLYQWIKGNQPNLPFILMTAYTSSEIIENSLASGVLTALHKPVNIPAILRFFTELSQTLRAAVISIEKDICGIIEHILQNKDFSFSVFKSIPAFISSSETRQFRIVFIDTHQPCDHFSPLLLKLLNKLPERTIVVICDYHKSMQAVDLPQKINLIILPRKEHTLERVDDILQKERLQHAREILK